MRIAALVLGMLGGLAGLIGGACVLAVDIHNNDQGIVWSGPKEVAELKRDQIRSAGPDFYAEKKIKTPLAVLIEPLPS